MKKRKLDEAPRVDELVRLFHKVIAGCGGSSQREEERECVGVSTDTNDNPAA